MLISDQGLNKYINFVIGASLAGAKGGNTADLSLWDYLARDEKGYATIPLVGLPLITAVENWIHAHVGNGSVVAGRSQKHGLQSLADCFLLECKGHRYCIGSDKLGHFFQQGYMAYEIQVQFGESYAWMFLLWTEGLLPPNIADYKGG